MSPTSHRCVCGATIRFRQDLEVRDGATRRHWTCRDCGTPVPGRVGERISHQHPS
ncbi:hypothetical protein [Natrononativus amylolyticus]|uniref:hypothetical protein n=1 Tax=Natrononativus amylolyticus TaxID=2963434 RepID=UPI0020CE8D03|nr:hypothetical protein [Natrononativus amylolyticus]